MLLTQLWLGLLVIAALAIFLQAGTAVLAVVFRRATWPPLAETASLAFGIGVGAIGTEMLLFSLLGVPYTLPALLAPWAVGWLLYAWYRAGARPRPGMARDGASRWSTCEVVVACLLAVLIGALLVRAAVWPLWWWDSWAIWGLKAKAFYHFRDATPFLADPYYGLTHPDYPILYPLAGTLLFLVLGGPHDIVQVLPVVFYGSSLLLFRSLLIRCGGGRGAAALATAALASAPNILSFVPEFLAEQASLWFALAAVGYTYVYARSRETVWLILGALSAGFLTQVRAEGVLLVAPILLFLLADAIADRTPGHNGWRARGVVSFAAVVVGVYLPWFVFSRIKVGVSGGVSQIGLADLVRGSSEILPIVKTIGQWMTSTTLLGPYVLLFPLLGVLVLANLGWYLRSLWQSYLLVMIATSAVPPIILLMTLPYWRSAPAMGRYLFLFTAFSLFALAVHVARLWPAPAVSTPSEHSEVVRSPRIVAAQRVACMVVALVACAVWVLADTVPAFAFPHAARPVQVVADVVTSWRELASLSRWDRIAYLERQSGVPQIPALVRYVEAACPAGQDVVLWSAADSRNAHYGGYLFQRSGYLLFPRKVHVAQSQEILEDLLTRDTPVGALISYGVPAPAGVSGEQAYAAGDASVVCRPVIMAAHP